MTLFEIFVPRGTLDEERRRFLAERIATEVVSAQGAPADLVERGRAITHVIIHEPDVWTVGGRPVEPNDSPPYLVRVTVPGGHLNTGMRAELIGRVTEVLAVVDEKPDRLYREPKAWVQIIELPDSQLGGFGQVMPTHEIVKMVVDPSWKPVGNGASSGKADGQETVIDPICGMTVVLDETAITLEHEGTTYGFCATSCRDIFAHQHGIVLA